MQGISFTVDSLVYYIQTDDLYNDLVNNSNLLDQMDIGIIWTLLRERRFIGYFLIQSMGTDNFSRRDNWPLAQCVSNDESVDSRSVPDCNEYGKISSYDSLSDFYDNDKGPGYTHDNYRSVNYSNDILLVPHHDDSTNELVENIIEMNSDVDLDNYNMLVPNHEELDGSSKNNKKRNIQKIIILFLKKNILVYINEIHLNRQIDNKSKTIEVLAYIKKHIDMFPVVDSHYTRQNTTNQYLESGLSIANRMGPK
ncbi:hypothetical protein AGLY_009026 [Aphis glycines]|uniref:Uncharacterized protein n=1 Tax=Aphis glycines TaxID=307491 RepID=A0A6G0TIZ7_APHGL|nr:hypothetical protein AGLY_009026 [Aphis glycines]